MNECKLTAKEWHMAVSNDGKVDSEVDRTSVSTGLVGCRNWKPKHGIGPYCANCGYHESEHRDTHPYTRAHPLQPVELPTSNPLASEYDRARAEFEYIHSCKPTEPEHHGWIAGYCAALRDARLADETTLAHQTVLGGHVCVHCGADLSNHPTSASAHVCQR